MLSTLRIKNFALVEEAYIEFLPGFNAITGETGAGKSILIGALSLLLGERADRTMIRSGADSCSVEAVFDITNLEATINSALESCGIEPCEEKQLIIKRILTPAGSTRQFINGAAVTLSTLKTIGDLLVDIHGAYEHQSLLNPACQLELLDAFGDIEKLQEEYANLVKKYQDVQTQIQSLVMDEQTFARELDLLQFQVGEISKANLKEGEDEELEAQYDRASNSAKLAQLCAELQRIVSDSDDSVHSKLNLAGRILNEIHHLDPSTEPLFQIHNGLIEQIQEFNRDMSRYSEKIELDEDQLKQIESRLDLINSLKRKYGKNLSDVINYWKEAEEKLNRLLRRNEDLALLSEERERIKTAIIKAAEKLSSVRKKVAPELGKMISRQISDLGFKQSRFEIKVDYKQPDFSSQIPLSGFDTVEFLFSPNPGEPLRQLRSIASSGELARVMLAVKTVLDEQDKIPLLVFDEVDANIGGETGLAVGEKMRQIGSHHQVFCITHLASVAAKAPTHYLVKKEIKNRRTYTLIERLVESERILELARMLGGKSQTAIEHAKALLKK